MESRTRMGAERTVVGSLTDADAQIRLYAGDCELAIEHLKRAMRLSPLDPLMHLAHSATAFGYFLQGNLDEASAWAERALPLRSNWPPALRVLAMSNALAGREQAAGEAMARLRWSNRDYGFRTSTSRSFCIGPSTWPSI